jgi:hypothetical protein
MAGRDLDNARKQKADEFYTQFADIEKELKHYKGHFRGKTVFCNCDDPYESNFFKYFTLKFNLWGLKKLIATCYIGSPVANRELSLFDYEAPENKTTKVPHKIIVNEATDENNDGGIDLQDIVISLAKNKKNTLTRLNGDGDFRSAECVEFLKESDIIVTNPPFSLFREYVSQLVEYDKKFLIIGNKNAITYKEIFKLIKEDKIWIGASIHSGGLDMRVPKEWDVVSKHSKYDKDGNRYVNMPGCRWFTNLDFKARHEDLIFYKTYNQNDYPKYDNYDAINVDKVADIPTDYEGAMGVPITFMDKFNPEQFEIIGLAASAGYDKNIVGLENKKDIKDARTLINGKNTYARIFIKHKYSLKGTAKK